MVTCEVTLHAGVKLYFTDIGPTSPCVDLHVGRMTCHKESQFGLYRGSNSNIKIFSIITTD